MTRILFLPIREIQKPRFCLDWNFVDDRWSIYWQVNTKLISNNESTVSDKSQFQINISSHALYALNHSMIRFIWSIGCDVKYGTKYLSAQDSHKRRCYERFSHEIMHMYHHWYIFSSSWSKNRRRRDSHCVIFYSHLALHYVTVGTASSLPVLDIWYHSPHIDTI